MLGNVIIVMVGILCGVFAYMLINKHRVSLIHSYHYTNVKKEDLPAYSEQLGKGLSLISLGAIPAALALFIELKISFVFLAFCVFFIMGLFVIVKAQKKYNEKIY